MKTKLKFQPTLKQHFHLSTSMKNNLEILSMDSKRIIEELSNLADKNPFIEYTPNEQIHELLINSFSSAPVLKDELYFQLHTCNKKYDSKICSYIIESLDKNGFFTIPLKQASHDLYTSEENFLTNLKLIQSFEPIGVAAKNSVDSICIQLARNNQFIAIKLLKDFEKELLENDYFSISKKVKLSIRQIEDLINEIRKCNPFPCSSYSTSNAQWIMPDVEIKIENDDLLIEPKEIGDIQLIKPQEKLMSPMLKEYLNQAKFTIDSLNKRNKTLLIVLSEIIKQQKGFFLYNDELRHITLKKIGESIGLSESTVSRTVSNKYYLFEDQLYPIKNLFTSQTKKGTSKDSIQKAITYLIKNEDPKSPFLDEELVLQLKELELFVSRRTISKYRLELNIPNSKIRKKQYEFKN